MSSISLAVMVRDDAPRLKRCIDSVKGAVDEIVVLDTGSKDDTVQVAKAAGAQVSEIEWPGSFSLGLNELMRQVSTDWTLRLDSDEWFEVDPSDALRRAMESGDAYGFKLVRRDILEGGQYRELSIFRLWRTHPELEYEGLVHENISNESIERAFPGMKVESLPLWFWHDGYARGSQDKLLRNIGLLEEELEQRPDQPYYRAMRAVMYRDLGDPRFLEELERVADEALVEVDPATRMYAGVFSALMQSVPDHKLRDHRIEHVIERSWKWFSNYPGILWSIGLVETRRQSSEKALNAFLRLRELAIDGRYERSMPFDPNILGFNLWNALGFTANQVGRYDIANECAQRLQQSATARDKVLR